ncbi:MAG: 4-hydroxy-tetrahydrodipicolinate synthase, partial [Vicinamibacteria bacterium]|nr:4-hydroxy-tetrahydrodipicolinate synthase [Vicinamibacteria bacterium]
MGRSFAGAGVALVTPFLRDGALDEASLRKLVRRQVADGIDVLVPCGTTGESATMSSEEQRRVIEITVNEAAGKVPVLAGAGSNDTRVAIEKSRAAAAAGAQGILSVGPDYNKPTAEGYFRHFSAIADASTIPVVIYNVPGRTGGNFDAKTQLRLAEHPNVAGVKEASGNLVQIMEVIRDAPPNFEILSGDDAMAMPIMAMGG